MPSPRIRVSCLPISLVLCTLAMVAAVGRPTRAWAQNPLPLGSVTFVDDGMNCPPDKDGHEPLVGAHCYTAAISGCRDLIGNFLPVVHAYVAISNPANTPTKGTIVMFNGGDGEDYPNMGAVGEPYAGDYVAANFQVAQVAWVQGETWRDDTDNPPVKSMKHEACRPATLLRKIYDSPVGHGGVTGSGGMCAQGHSTGATAISDILAWYGAGSGATGYLDAALLTAGPPHADLRAGCQYPAVPPFDNPIPVCTNNKCVGTSWTNCTQYVNGTGIDCGGNAVENGNAAAAVANYTNHPPGNCHNYTGTGLDTHAFDMNWKQTSVVSTGAVFSYPNTAVLAFLCATGFGPTDLPNNSASQAWQYLDSLDLVNTPHRFYRVDGCIGSEVIWGPNATTLEGGGFQVSRDRMEQQCVKRHF